MIETDDFNPYSSPGVPASVLQPIREARVDGRCIVVNSGTQLPLRCVTTNVDCSHDDLRARLLSYAPSGRQSSEMPCLSLLVGGQKKTPSVCSTAAGHWNFTTTLVFLRDGHCRWYTRNNAFYGFAS